VSAGYRAELYPSQLAGCGTVGPEKGQFGGEVSRTVQAESR
jgi:hypothetical protein